MNEEENKKIIIRARGVFVHEGKMLVVKHRESADYYAFPGGHLEWGEDPVSCIRREIKEELGIEPEIGRLLYVNTFIVNSQTTEFFFEIKNTKDYFDKEKLKNGTHSHELFEIIWANKDFDQKILPEEIFKDFKNDTLLQDITRFIS